ncbi:MAG: hypothetical protein QMD08_00185 [Actinomycetota bacterium]|nr:hypothetical protein [Actinomycetota bacterium]
MIAQVKSKVDEEQETRTYTYDFQNRLEKVEIVKGDETKVIEYEYDGLGNRISRIETKPDGKKEVTNYINDISNPLTQVLQERNENNSVVQGYVHGLDLVSKINEKSIFLIDFKLQLNKRAPHMRIPYEDLNCPPHLKLVKLKLSANWAGGRLCPSTNSTV